MSGLADQFPISRDISSVVEGFNEGVSVSAVVAGANIGMSALGLFLDPVAWVVGQIMEPIYNWILSNLPGLKQVFDFLTGAPAAIKAVGDCVSEKGSEVLSREAEFTGHCQSVNGSWGGPSQLAFQALMLQIAASQKLLGAILKACGVGIEAVAAVVNLIKEFIITMGKDLLNQLISKAVMSVLASFVTFGAAYAAYTAWAAGFFARVMGKITGLLKKLADFGAKNTTKYQKLNQALQKASASFGRMQSGWNNTARLAANAKKLGDEAKAHAKTADSLDAASKSPMSDAPYYGGAPKDAATKAAQDATRRSTAARPDPLGKPFKNPMIPGTKHTVPVGSEAAASSENQRHDGYPQLED